MIMTRFKKGSKEAQEWGLKMREAKKTKQSVVIPTSPKIDAPDFIVEIVKRYFPEAGLKAVDRENDYSIEITVKEGDIRAFVVDKITAKIETENWCKRIKANIEGRSVSAVTGTNLMTGIKEQTKKLPSELGKESEFFFREE